MHDSQEKRIQSEYNQRLQSEVKNPHDGIRKAMIQNHEGKYVNRG